MPVFFSWEIEARQSTAPATPLSALRRVRSPPADNTAAAVAAAEAPHQQQLKVSAIWTISQFIPRSSEEISCSSNYSQLRRRRRRRIKPNVYVGLVSSQVVRRPAALHSSYYSTIHLLTSCNVSEHLTVSTAAAAAAAKQ